MHVLCCLVTQSSSTPPYESALTMSLSREYKIKFPDEKEGIVEEKMYRVDMKIRWESGMFDRAVEMLGERLWGHIKIEEVEMILHAMAYQSTGKVDMLYVSDYMKAATEWSRECQEIACDRKIFEKAYNILIEKEKDIVGGDDMVKILHLMEHLNIRKEWKEACYGKLARKTMYDYKSAKKEAAIGDIKRFRESMVANGRKQQSFSLYMQHLLGLFAKEHGMSLTVDEKRKTLDLWSCINPKERGQRVGRTGEWKLRVEMRNDYRRHTEVQQMAEILIEVMCIIVEVEIGELWRGDRKIVERIISKALETRISIWCVQVEPGAIAKHMEGLQDNIIELYISYNRNLCEEDWKTIGEMTRLERLKVGGCDIQAGWIAKYMQNLNLVELDVSYNRNLCEEDWKTIGEMTRLEILDIKCCFTIQPGTIAKYMQNQKNNLVELNVSWNGGLSNEDWKTVGEMTRLEILYANVCDIQAGAIAEHMQKLNLVKLNVSENRNLCDDDWKTVGGMKKLEFLNISDCNLQAGMIAQHMQKFNLVELNVSSNRNLGNEDWKTMGEMTRLECLNIRDCNLQAGTIAQHMCKLNLVELDISWNRNINEGDWKTVGEMTRLERLNIIGCGIQKEQFSRYLEGLRCRIQR
eukprot:jgi/Antlo1/1589/741